MMARFSSKIGVAGDTATEYLFDLTHSPKGLAHLDPIATPATMERAVELGLHFLADCQRRDGAWVDFLLHPGASVEWITAHVAFVLENVPAARRMTSRAAGYLASTGRSDGGWGYCRRVANDCDSTAQALMVLSAHGIETPRFIVDWLLAAQSPSGGFPTYPAMRGAAPGSGWQHEHPDVTLIVAEALGRLGVEPAIRQRAFDWLEATTAAPLVRSYWWPSPAYSAWVQARVGFHAAKASRKASEIISRHLTIPELPMLLAAANSHEQSTSLRKTNATTALIAQQWADGSWPCRPCLRVTDSTRNETSSLDGPVFAGTRRVFSTAHAVAALAIQD